MVADPEKVDKVAEKADDALTYTSLGSTLASTVPNPVTPWIAYGASMAAAPVDVWQAGRAFYKDGITSKEGWLNTGEALLDLAGGKMTKALAKPAKVGSRAYVPPTKGRKGHYYTQSPQDAAFQEAVNRVVIADALETGNYMQHNVRAGKNPIVPFFNLDGTPAWWGIQKVPEVVVTGHKRKKALGGNLFDDGGYTQQTIYQTDDGRYVLANDEEVTPLNAMGEDASQWSYIGSDGRIYSPHRDISQGEVTEINPFSRQAQELRDERWLNERQNNATFLTNGLYSAIRNWREGKTPMQALQGVGLMPYYDSENVAGLGQLVGFAKELKGAYDYAKPIVATRTPIPFAEKQAAAQRMQDFIHSGDYLQRQQAAGLSSKEVDAFQNLVSRRLKNGKFPAFYSENLEERGLSLTLPFVSGVYTRKGLTNSDFINTIDHEAAHYSTVNFDKEGNGMQRLTTMERPELVEKMLNYNDQVAPVRSLSEMNELRKAKDLKPLDADHYDYYRDAQERRANAYSMLQEAKRRGMTTDEFVDLYTSSTGEIDSKAPLSLRFLNYSYSPENMKKYLKGFLSLSAPITLGLSMPNEKDN